MLSSLWQQVIGTTGSNSDDDESDSVHNSKSTQYYSPSPPPTSHQKRYNTPSNTHNQSRISVHIPSATDLIQQTIDSEDDKLVDSLLSRFPPYGSHSALIRKFPHNNVHLIGSGGAAGAAAAAAIAVNGSDGGSVSNEGTGTGGGGPHTRSQSGSPTRRHRTSNRGEEEARDIRSRSLSVKNQRYYDDYYNDNPHGYDGDGDKKEKTAAGIWSNYDELDIWKSTNQIASPSRRRRRHRRFSTKGGGHRPTVTGGGSGTHERRHSRGHSRNSNHSNNYDKNHRDTNTSGHKEIYKKDTRGETGIERKHPHLHHSSRYQRDDRRRQSNHGRMTEDWNEELRKQWITEASSNSSSKATTVDANLNGSAVTSSGVVVKGSEVGSGSSGSQSRNNTVNPHRRGDTGNFPSSHTSNLGGKSSSAPNSRLKGGNGSTTINSDNDRGNNGGARSRQHFTFSFDDGDDDDYSSYEESTSSTEDYYYDDDYSDDGEYYNDYDDGYDNTGNKNDANLSRFNRQRTHRSSNPPHNTNNAPITGNSDGIVTSNDTTGSGDQSKKGWQLSYQQNEENQHWMPDKLCKTCYACESQFSFYRRRHHCRLCGQVFCSRCSTFFVEIEGDSKCGVGAADGITGHGLEANRLGISSSSIRMDKNDGAGTSGAAVDPRNIHSDKDGGGSDGGSEARLPVRTIRTCKLCYDHVSESNGGTVVAAAVRTWFGSRSRKKFDSDNNKSKEGDGDDILKDNISSSTNPDQKHNLTSVGKDEAASLDESLAHFSPIDHVASHDNKSSKGDQSESSQQQEVESKLSGITACSSDEFAYASLAQQLSRNTGSGSYEGEILTSRNDNTEADHTRRRRMDQSEEEIKLSSKNGGDDSNFNWIRSGGSSGSSSMVCIVDKPKTKSSSTTRRFGRLAESAARENLVGDHGFNDEEVKLVGTGVSDPSEQEEELDADNGGGAEKHPNIESIPAIPSALTLEEDGKGKVVDTMANSGDGGRQNESYVNIEKQCANTVKQANQQLGLCAANHLEKLGRELLQSEAPLLLEEKGIGKERCDADGNSKLFDNWVNSLMMLATRCCATVTPNLRQGDMLDIRPYCKVKVIPGGKLEDAAYISGIVFHKNVSHKAMAKEVSNPRIMLLSSGIEYTRTENKFASLDTILEQESKYMEIVVTRITKLKPDVLMVGRSVNRKAQELLLSKTNIVLLQHVKVGLMERIARQTGATILSSMHQIMNQFGSAVLGKCRRFRLVAFRNNELWHDNSTATVKKKSINQSQNIPTLLTQKDLPNHLRQAALAASLLGESVHSAQDAVRAGIAKRGVAMTYGLIEGCPSHLGCTVVLRGASRPALKQVKRLLQFLINAAYNLKLETSYLRARRAMLPTPGYTIDPTKPTMSTSLCVDYGDPPVGRKVVRPWNGGGKGDFGQRSISGKITALDHQSILISSVWMAGKTQCCPAELKGICYYSKQDVSLGEFLRDSCLNLQVKCQNLSCKKSVLDHSLSFMHNDGIISIKVEKMDKPLPPETLPKESNSAHGTNGENDNTKSKRLEGTNAIATWSYCLNCSKVVTPMNYLTEDTWKLSFGKFLEVSFYNKEMRLNAPEHKCSCTMQSASTLYFGCGDLAARFTYERIRPYGVYLRRHLPSDEKFHKDFTFTELDMISKAAKELFDKFDAKIIDITRDTRQLFEGGNQYQQQQESAQHVQTILSELNTISSEVRRASKILQEKITSVTKRFRVSQQETATSYGEGSRIKAQEAFMCFPWHSRRYLFLLASAWNDRLSTIGQALVARKKFLSSIALLYSSSINTGRLGGEMGLPQASGGDIGDDDVLEAMQRLRQLRDVYSNLNVNDISIQPTPKESLRYTRRNSNSTDVKELNDINYDDLDEEFGDAGENMAAVGNEEVKFNFAEEVDADVLASRQRRHAQTIDPNGSSISNSTARRHNGRAGSRSRSRGRGENNKNNNNNNQDNAYSNRRGRRKDDHLPSLSHHGPSSRSSSRHRSSRSQSPSPSRSRPVTAGGAVKSIITRFLNRGNKEQDPYVIELGIFSDGRPKLEPGIDGIVVPIFDDQPSTIIAYSLSSVEYNVQFNHYVKSESSNKSTSETRRPSSSSSSSRGGGDNAAEDFFAGPGSVESPHRLKQDSSHHIAPHKRGRSQHRSSTQSSSTKINNGSGGPFDEKKSIERRMLVRNKTHIKHTFRDHDEKGQQIAVFVCTTYWATQFQAVRHAFLKDPGTTEYSSSAVGGGGGNGGIAQTSRFVSERGRLTIEKSYNKSLSTSTSWAASGGKSGASFSKTSDDRFIVKCISRTELQMFLESAPAYFEYVSKAFFQGLPTMLSKIVGVYQIGYHNRVTGKRTMVQVAVMQNIFFKRKISKVFDLKGTGTARYAKRPSPSDKEKNENQQAAATAVDSLQISASGTQKVSIRGSDIEISIDDDDSTSMKDDANLTNLSISDGEEDGAATNTNDNSEKKRSATTNSKQPAHDNDTGADDFDSTMLDGDFLEFTNGRPLPLNDRAKAMFHMSILNDTLFLSFINVLDYSILVGIDEERNELVVGIIDFMRQYDILKQMERVGKSIPMVVGSEAPTIIQPPLYKARFITAMTRYFMTVPCKWTTI